MFTYLPFAKWKQNPRTNMHFRQNFIPILNFGNGLFPHSHTATCVVLLWWCLFVITLLLYWIHKILVCRSSHVMWYFRSTESVRCCCTIVCILQYRLMYKVWSNTRVSLIFCAPLISHDPSFLKIKIQKLLCKFIEVYNSNLIVHNI
jgi:hypothetical protein